MEEEDSAEPDVGEALEEGGRSPQPIQGATSGDRQTRVDPSLETRNPEVLLGALPKDRSAESRSSQGAAGVTQWPGEEQVTQTRPGNSSQEASEMQRSLEDAAKVKEELLDEDSGSLAMQQEPFCQGGRENGRQLWELFRQRGKPQDHAKEEALEQFLGILPKEEQTGVRERGPETMAQAVAVAEGFAPHLQDPDRCDKKVRALH